MPCKGKRFACGEWLLPQSRIEATVLSVHCQENRTAGVPIMKKVLILVGEQFHYFPAFFTFFFKNEDRPDWSVYYLGS